MTALLATPPDWPRVLLARAAEAVTTTARSDTIPEGAFAALERSIRDLGPAGAIATVAASGLRGRGGAGFPTGEKWRACASQKAARRFVVANGYSADPAVFTDATLMTLDPWSVVEGLAIAAYAVGATEAVVAIRADASEAIAAIEAAIDAAEGAGYLGPDVMGSGWDISVSIRALQGAYMLGEETVLLKALEGKRGQPEQRPPYPTEKGLFGQPTVVNNVQTLAVIPWIIRQGAQAYAGIGSKGSPGTILVQVRAPFGDGIAEVPLGTPLRDVVGLARHAPATDGARRGSRAAAAPASQSGAIKAVLVGGPSGGLLPPSLLDTPYEFDALRDVGAHIGSGSVVVADERSCVVDLARLLTGYCSDEACGKSIPCRIGLRRLSEIGDRITSGRPRPTDIALLSDLSSDVVGSGLCDHERLATLPFTTGMRYFRPELDDHILRSTCPAGVCRPIALASGAAR